MSRIIIKNLPDYIGQNPEKLKELFATQGLITDLQLKFATNGKFRKFAFIGFLNDEQAALAIKKFHKSFINTSRIQVQLASDLKDTSKPRSWSRYSKDSSAFHKQSIIKKFDIEPKINNIIEISSGIEYNNNHSLQTTLNNEMTKISDKKYMSQKIKRQKISDNNNISNPIEVLLHDNNYIKCDLLRADNINIESNPDKDIDNHQKCMPLFLNSSGKPKTIIQQRHIAKLSNLPNKVTKNQILKFFEPKITQDHIQSVKLVRIYKKNDEKIKSAKKSIGSYIAMVEFTDEVSLEFALLRNKTLLKNRFVEMERIAKTKILKIKQSEVTNYNCKESFKIEINIDGRREGNENYPNMNYVPSVLDSGRIFLRNLPYICTEDDIEKLFSKYGRLIEVNLPLDKLNQRIKGFGFVTFLLPVQAQEAFLELDGTIFMGRMLHLIPSHEPKENIHNVNNLTDPSSSYKTCQNTEKVATASKKTQNWNSLFVDSAAIANVMATKYKVDKRELYGNNLEENDIQSKKKSSSAVKLALGETEVVNEMKTFLIENGVRLETEFKRSKTIILVKNLPAETKQEDMRRVFEKFGQISRLVLPPSYGLSCIVEFIEPQDARKAFKSLAYTRFKDVPLYLEWAPIDCLIHNKDIPITSKTEKNMNNNSAPTNTESISNISNSTTMGSTLFVKNLNFSTTNFELQKMFASFGDVCAKIAYKRDPSNPIETLSMGYGFLTFQTEQLATLALKELQGKEFNGHKMELLRSNSYKNAPLPNIRRLTSSNLTDNATSSNTNILVRNVPFQANISEIRELFSAFGHVDSVRLPRKFSDKAPETKKNSSSTNQSRGFAFVKFANSVEASRALEALQPSSHLYGRRLVLEWARDDSIMIQNQESNLHQNEIKALKNNIKYKNDNEIANEDKTNNYIQIDVPYDIRKLSSKNFIRDDIISKNDNDISVILKGIGAIERRPSFRHSSESVPVYEYPTNLKNIKKSGFPKFPQNLQNDDKLIPKNPSKTIDKKNAKNVNKRKSDRYF
ncbi:unnamed protein product [Gordionus sp. m RMFG-2023]